MVEMGGTMINKQVVWGCSAIQLGPAVLFCGCSFIEKSLST